MKEKRKRNLLASEERMNPQIKLIDRKENKKKKTKIQNQNHEATKSKGRKVEKMIQKKPQKTIEEKVKQMKEKKKKKKDSDKEGKKKQPTPMDKKLKEEIIKNEENKNTRKKVKKMITKENSEKKTKKVLKNRETTNDVIPSKKSIKAVKNIMKQNHSKMEGKKLTHVKSEKRVNKGRKILELPKEKKNKKKVGLKQSTKKEITKKKKSKKVNVDKSMHEVSYPLDIKEDESFSKKMISFLSTCNEKEKKEKKNKREKKGEEATVEDYEYYPLKDNIYDIKEKKEKKMKIDDLVFQPKDTLHNNLSSNIKYLQNEKVNSYDNSLSFLQQQKINASLAYIDSVKSLNKHNVDVDRIRKAYQVLFGKTFEAKEPHSNKLKKSTLDKFKQREQQKKEKEEKTKETKEEDRYDKKQFTDELKENIKMSQVFEDVHDMLKSNRQKKKEEHRKIAYIKKLLHEEQLKNKYRKKIKSKGYRHYLKLKDKKIKEKLLKKLGEDHPDIVEQFQKYEEEYAKKRILNKDNKLKKQLKLRKRYKNDEIRKEVLKKMQEEKEEKMLLKRIIEKTAMKEDFRYSTMLQNEKKEISEKLEEHDDTSSVSSSNRNDNSNKEEEEETTEEKSLLRKELEKRNLLKYSFIQKAEAMKEVEEKNKRRIFSEKLEGESACLLDDAASILTNEELEDENTFLNKNQKEKKKGLPQITEDELNKAKKKLLKDSSFVNLVNTYKVLDLNDVLEEPQFRKNPKPKEIEEDKGNVLKVIMEEGAQEDEDLNENNYGKEKEKKESIVLPIVRNTSVQEEVKDICEINNIEGEEVYKKPCFESKELYNFENQIYENYINVMNHANPEDADPVELSDSEESKLRKNKIKLNEWVNYETLQAQEKQRMKEEKELLEKKKNIPLHTITVNEKKDKQFDKYYIEKAPYPYNENEYEKSLNININKEVNTTKEFKSLIAPHISNKIGNIIAPLNRNLHKLANLILPKKKKPKASL